MKDKTLAGHAALAGLALIAAGFAAWGPELREGEQEAVVVAGKAADLQAVSWRDDRYDVVVRRSSAGSDQLQVEVASHPHPGAAAAKPAAGEGDDGDDDEVADGGGEAAPPAAIVTGAPVAPPKVYPGSPQAKELFDAMGPLTSPRSLGVIDAAKLGGMGLDKPGEHLSLEQSSGKKALDIGDAVYGSGDRYVRAESGEVFLLQAKTLAGLRNGGASLIERRALPLEPEKVVRVEISAGANRRDLIQRNAEAKDKAYYADPAEPDQKLEQVSGWIDRVLKLRIVDFAAAPAKGSPTLTVEVFDGSASLGRLSLWNPDDKMAVGTSTFFGGPVTLSKANAEAVLRDLDAVMSEGK